MKTVVIFGGSGFIGHNIVRRLSKQGSRIIVPYQRSANEAKLRLYGQVGQIIPLKFISLDENRIKSIIENSDVVLNLKTIWQEKKANSYEKNILNFNIQLIDFINATNKNKAFIFFSGLGINENSPSKRVRNIAKVEDYIINNLNNTSIIRPGVILGEGGQFLRKLLPIIKLSFFIPLFGSGSTKLQPVFVEDVVDGVEVILKEDIKGNNIYELTGSEIFTYKSLYQLIIKYLGLKRIFVPIPFVIAKIIVSVAEKTPFNLLTKDQLLLFKENSTSSNQSKSFKDLGISPKNIRDIFNKIII